MPIEPPTLDISRVGTDIREIVSFGSRYAGTPGEAACKDFLVARFEAAGLESVRLEEFSYLGYQQQESHCRFLTSNHAFACTGLQGTAPGVAEGEAIFLGCGTETELQRLDELGASLEGKVAVVNYSAAGSLTVIGRELQKRGVIGLVAIAISADDVLPNYTAFHYVRGGPEGLPAHTFPGVTIVRGDGDRLLSAMSAGAVEIRIEHNAAYAETVGHNVVGELPGEILDSHVLVAGHYDTQWDCPGATDNASGTAVLLELARTWADLKLRRTVVFASWAAEEPGSYGAASYVARHVDLIPQQAASITLDAMGQPLAGKRGILASPEMEALAEECALACEWSLETKVDATTSREDTGDHTPFVDEGIPAVFFWRHPPVHPYYHTPLDIERFLRLDHVDDVARVSAMTALSVVQADAVPLRSEVVAD